MLVIKNSPLQGAREKIGSVTGGMTSSHPLYLVTLWRSFYEGAESENPLYIGDFSDDAG